MPPGSGRSSIRSTKILRRPPASRPVPAADDCTAQLSPQASGRAPHAPRDLPAPIQLLLRARRLPQASDSALGALPRTKGLPRRRGHSGRRSAARANTTPSPRWPLTSAPIGAPSPAGRSSGAISFPTLPSGRSHALGWPRTSISRPFHWSSSTPSSVGLMTTAAGERLLRFLAPMTIPGALRIALS